MKLRYFSIGLLIVWMLAACAPQAAATALPTVVLDSGSATQPPAAISFSLSDGAVAASGVLAPQHTSQLAFSIPGSLKSVDVAVGQQVEAGQLLAELDGVLLQLQLEQAERVLRELTSPAAVAAAAQELAVARQTLKDQQDKLDAQSYRRASDTLLENTQGEIDLAKQALARASDAYKLVARQPEGDSRKAAALVALTNAQLRLNDLQARYNWYSGKASDIDAALAQARLDAAKAAQQESEWYLALLQGEKIPAEATGSRLAQLEEARAAVTAAQDSLAHARLVSPIAGTLIKVNALAGESVSPGQLLFVISDVRNLHVETTDLSERDVPKVKLGQPVVVAVKALGINITGRVTRISPLADTLGGDVVYATEIALDETPPALLAGMSVDVVYQVEP